MTSRLAVARRRVRLARTALLGGGVVVFGVTMALARAQFPGHHKHGVTTLSPPSAFVDVVRRNQLAAGILAPAQAPPGIGSAPS
ncbi:MAG TPA: hypothetical protein VMU73_03390 [Gaiellaceae bacterium]|nr:hypothetical protein [Gaiellaceae bacterium]